MESKRYVPKFKIVKQNLLIVWEQDVKYIMTENVIIKIKHPFQRAIFIPESRWNNGFPRIYRRKIYQKKLSTLRNQGAFLMPKIDRSEVVKLRIEWEATS